MKLIYYYFYLASQNQELVKALSNRWPNHEKKINGAPYKFSMLVDRGSEEHLEICKILTSMGVSTKPNETRRGEFEKKDYERAKYFRGGPKKYVQPGYFSQLVDGKVILNKKLPKFRYGIATGFNIVSEEVKLAIEAQPFKGVAFIPVYLSRRNFDQSDKLVNPEVDLIPGIYALRWSLLLPYASTPDPLYNGTEKPIVPCVYSIRDFEALDFPDAVGAPVGYQWPNHIKEEDAGHSWSYYSKRFCNFLTETFKEFEWEPVVLAEDTL